jgi:hypothetical protein
MGGTISESVVQQFFLFHEANKLGNVYIVLQFCALPECEKSRWQQWQQSCLYGIIYWENIKLTWCTSRVFDWNSRHIPIPLVNVSITTLAELSLYCNLFTFSVKYLVCSPHFFLNLLNQNIIKVFQICFKLNLGIVALTSEIYSFLLLSWTAGLVSMRVFITISQTWIKIYYID